MDYIWSACPNRRPHAPGSAMRIPPLGPMRIMAETITHADFVLLSPAGHFANRDQPEAFNRTVLEFLAGLGA